MGKEIRKIGGRQQKKAFGSMKEERQGSITTLIFEIVCMRI